VLAGLILGPSVLNYLGWPIFDDPHLGDSITHLAELGILLLMFIAGLDLHLSDLARSGKAAALAGIFGFVLTLGVGVALAGTFAFDSPQSLYFGLLLVPTSIGISAQTLMELRMLRSKVGVGLLGAAVVDDTLTVVGISLFLALFGGDLGGQSSALVTVLKMPLYLVCASAVGIWLIPRLSRFVEQLPVSQGLVAFTFVTVLLYAWTAEALGGMAAIMGAFMAGLFLARSPLRERIEAGFMPLAYGIFVPIFFVNVGLSADVGQLANGGLGLLGAMCLVVILTKMLGAGLAGRFGGLKGREALQMGVGMIPRGEVTLIIATVGITEGFIGDEVFSAAVGMVIITTLLAPPLLRLSFARGESAQFSTGKSWQERK
jgi:Kef-type K+ transport system membrane component KefB